VGTTTAENTSTSTNRLRDVLINSAGTTATDGVVIDPDVNGVVTIGQDEANTTDTFLARTLKTNAAGISGRIILGGGTVSTGGTGGDVILSGDGANSLDLKSNFATTNEGIIINANTTVATGNIALETTQNNVDIVFGVNGLQGTHDDPGGTGNSAIATRRIKATNGDVTTTVFGSSSATKFQDFRSGGSTTAATGGMNTIATGNNVTIGNGDYPNSGGTALDNVVYPHIESPTITQNYNGDVELGTDAIGELAAAVGNFFTDAELEGMMGTAGTTLIVNVTSGNVILDIASSFTPTAAPAGANLSITTDTGYITDASAAADGNGLAFQSAGSLTLQSAHANGIGTFDAGGAGPFTGNTDGTMRVDVGSLTVNGTGGFGVNITDTGAVNGDTTFSVTTGGGGDVTLSQLASNMVLGDISTTGNLSASTTNGSITDSNGATIAVGMLASFSGGTGGLITLGDNAGDTTNFGTLRFNTTGAVNITEDSAMVLENTSTANSLSLTANGSITDDTTGTVSVTTTSTLVAGAANDIVLDVATNDFVGNVTIDDGLAGNDANNVTLADANSLSFSTITITGNLVANVDRGADDAATLDFSSSTVTVGHDYAGWSGYE